MYDIMVVDDSAEIRTGLSLKLAWREYGFRVLLEASNGDEALTRLYERRVPVIITDIRMPVMDGLGLLRECAVRYPEIKTVVLSGYDDFPLVQTALRQGAKDYLLKPVLKNELIAVLAKIRRELDDERDAALYKIAHDHIPPHEVRPLLSFYGMSEWIDPGTAVRFVTAEMRVPASRLEEGRWNGTSFKAAFHLTMTEIASLWENDAVIFRDVNQSDRVHFIVRQTPTSSLDECDGPIGRFLQDIRDKIVRFLRLELVVGIGHPARGVGEWKAGMESSLLSLSRSKPEAVSQTIYDDGTEDDHDQDQALSNAVIRRFAVAIENANERQMLLALDEIAQIGKSSSLQSFSFFLVQLCLALDELVRKHDLKDLDLQQMLWPYINSEWRYESIDKMIGSIKDISARVIRSFQLHKGKGREDTIAAIRKYIHQHYGEEELTLSAVANMYHYNAAYLSDLFRKMTGSTFSDYLLKIRMENASRLLQDGGLKIADVAQLAGFSSPAYFSNVFKGYYGMGPNEYRKSIPAAEN